MRLVIMFQVMQLLLQLLVVQLNCSSNYFYKNLHYFDSHLDCDYSYQKCKKTSTATAAPPPPAPNSTVLPQQWILPFYQHYLMITTLQLFLHLFGSADRVWVNFSAKNPWERPHYPISYSPKKKLVRLGQSSTYNNHC